MCGRIPDFHLPHPLKKPPVAPAPGGFLRFRRSVRLLKGARHRKMLRRRSYFLTHHAIVEAHHAIVVSTIALRRSTMALSVSAMALRRSAMALPVFENLFRHALQTPTPETTLTHGQQKGAQCENCAPWLRRRSGNPDLTGSHRVFARVQRRQTQSRAQCGHALRRRHAPLTFDEHRKARGPQQKWQRVACQSASERAH